MTTRDAQNLAQIMQTIGREALAASVVLANATRAQKDCALSVAAAELRARAGDILGANVRWSPCGNHWSEPARCLSAFGSRGSLE
jgi:hypothetical protein